MSATSVFSPVDPRHASHKLKGYLQYHRFGPSGEQRCVNCGARRWAETREFGPDCGGSIEFDSKAKKECKPDPRLMERLTHE